MRTKVLDTLAQYASGGGLGPIHLGLLFLKICARLAVEGIIPPRPDGAKFASLQYLHYTDSFPDYGVSPDIAAFVRQVLWALYVQGILSPSPQPRQVVDRYEQNPDLIPLTFLLDLDCAMLTPYGVDILSDTSKRIQVHDRDGYLANFLNADPPPDREIMRYLEEGVAVFRGGHFFATVVLLGIASERLVDVLAENLRDALGDPRGAERFERKYSNKRYISARFKALSRTLMGEYGEELNREKLRDPFQCVVKPTFDQIRCARNDIAHPSGREFTWNEVSGLLHNFVQYFDCTNRVIALLRSNTRTT